MLLFCCFSPVRAQLGQELSGAIIFNDICESPEYPASNVFDNDPDTYFRSCPPFGNWIGLDLGEKQIVTGVAYCPRMDTVTDFDYRERVQLGIFEGANSPDFSDAIPLFIIPGLAERRLTEQAICCTRGFRYVRFVFPYISQANRNNYMAELKFYGYRGDGDDSQLPQLTNLPLVSIHTEDRREILKDVYVKGIISVISDGGTKIHTDSLEIRGRGNSSWTFPKKPYRIKLFNSASLLNMPANARNWTLINNYGDKTLMRNMLAFDFSRRIEMPYTSPAEPVDVVLNGDYIGCYQLCDHIDVRENRVEVEEMSPADTLDGNLTGGYLIEIDAYYTEEPKTFVSERYRIPVTIQYPDNGEIAAAQENYIEAHFNRLTDAVYDGRFNDPQAGFRKYLYMDTFLKYFLIGEYSGNTDTYWSARMYKRRGDDQFHFGPVWDFDLGFDNDNRTYPVSRITEWMAFSYGNAAGDAKNFIARIIYEGSVTAQLREMYDHYRRQNIISKDVLLQELDGYAALLEQSQDLNFKRWRILNIRVHLNPAVYGSYAAEVENVRKYISERMDWLDRKLNYSGPGSHTETVARNDRITLETGKGFIRINGIDAPVPVRIVDVTGKIIFDGTVAENPAAIAAAKGIYFVILNGRTAQKRICKTIVM